MPIPRNDPLHASLVASLFAFFVPIYAVGGGVADAPHDAASALPATADAARGALLSDRWWAETGAPAPTTARPRRSLAG